MTCPVDIALVPGGQSFGFNICQGKCPMDCLWGITFANNIPNGLSPGLNILQKYTPPRTANQLKTCYRCVN